jgi:hypothetical protein
MDGRDVKRSAARLSLAAVTLWCLWSAGCGAERIPLPPPKADPVQGLSTPRIAVLPFTSRSREAGIAHLFRVSLYSHLCARPFRDIELPVVDVRLGREPGSVSGPDRARFLGERLGADLLVTGRVLDFDRVYAGVYSQMGIEAAIEVWDGAAGRRIWSDRHRVDSREGGLPFNPLEIPFIGVRSGYHLRDGNKVRIVDELSRHLAWRVPMPRTPAPAPDRFELQVHAFSDRERAEATILELRTKGYPAYLTSGTDRAGTWHRVVLGPYESREKAVRIRAELPRSLAAGAFVRQVRR